MLLLALLTMATPGPTRPASPANGRELLAAMHDRYAGQWYRALSFVQSTTRADGKVETWYEAASIPGKLRIDFGADTARTTLLFVGDSIYQFVNRQQKAAQPFVHPLMVLGFDVYAQPVEKTISQLTGLGFDLDRIHADSWQGHPVYVVGAAAGDTTSAQFWVDQDRLLFVRMLQPTKRDSTKVAETQFNDYRRLGGGWVSAEVRFTIGGKLAQLEQYRDIKGDPALPGDLWDAAKLPDATWMGKRN